MTGTALDHRDILAAFMPADYIIVVERRLVLTRVYGVVADEDVIGHARRFSLWTLKRWSLPP